MPLTPVLSARWTEPESWTIATYERHDGYQALRKALTMNPDDIIAEVKASGLRGRGGAQFPAGLKWSFIPQGDGKPHYLVVNADEGEPETCKDVPLLMADPHSLIEGIICTCFAVRANHAFVYIRGEVIHAIRRLRAAVAEAYEKGYLGTNILGSGFDCDLVVHTGAGSYECGEETALLSSLMGGRGQPTLKPPFPAVSGLYHSPTLINNVETITCVPYIIRGGADWWKSMGVETAPGPKLYQISGHVEHPGIYEMPHGTTFRELLEVAGGVWKGRQLKAWQPGGASCTLNRADDIGAAMDPDGLKEIGSTLGTAGAVVIDDQTCIVKVVARLIEFYRDESCGKCTPCREGTYWLAAIMDRIEKGGGVPEDIETMQEICRNIAGRSFCALGDAATVSILSSIERFRDEFDAHIERHGCPYGHTAAVGVSA